MNKILMSLFFGMFLLTGSCLAQPAPEVVVKERGHEHERHPEIHKAIHRLKMAKEDLEKASHDFGGHRVKAIEAIDRAMEELKDALEFDKK